MAKKRPDEEVEFSRRIVMSPDAFDEVRRFLDNPPEANEKLKALMGRTPIWERPAVEGDFEDDAGK